MVETLSQTKKHAGGPRPSPLISELVTKGQMSFSNEGNAQALFNATCVATSECEMQNAPPKLSPRIPERNNTYHSPPFMICTKTSISKSINTTHQVKAPGPDNIQTWVWITAWDFIRNHMLLLFNSITTLEHILQRWNVAQRVILAKQGKSDDTWPGSYIHIALLNSISKVYKKALTQYSFQKFKRNSILHPGHYGARPTMSALEP